MPGARRCQVKRNQRTTEDIQRPGKVAYFRDKYVAENLAFGTVCRVGRRWPSLAPRIAKLVSSSVSERDLIDDSFRVFASPRLVRFVEMEYGIPLECLPEAVQRVREVTKHLSFPSLFPIEVRVSAADDIALSTGFGRSNGWVAVHQYVGAPYESYFQQVADIMDSYGGRPHWGKMHYLNAAQLCERYPRWGEFQELRAALDPDGTFRNEYVDRARRAQRKVIALTRAGREGFRVAERRRTSTSDFGAGRRESHDASGFYSRFEAPVVSDDETIAGPTSKTELFICGDARDLSMVEPASVALVVTSPPYFAGKQYENELERDGIPASYLEYLDMLTDVFAECVRVLEPGGRIAVNVANLGRRPYRSLSADVITILQDRLGLLLRGEVVWRKGAGASGSCAWGSFRQPSNPVLRDLTERVVIASKGRFQRAVSRSAASAMACRMSRRSAPKIS